jgi:hypothetical protein
MAKGEFKYLPYKDWVSSTLQGKIIRYILIALIAGFFAIPLVAMCWNVHTCAPKPIASILLLFFR